MTLAPNFRQGSKCCANCEHGILVNGDRFDGYRPVVKCDKYGSIPILGGVCDDWEED